VKLIKNASKSDYVHFCTGEPRYYIDLMKDIKGKIALDPAQEIHRIWNPELLTEAMEKSQFLFGNNFEFESIMKYLKVDDLKMIDLPLVVCTCGADGSEAVIDGERFHIPAVKAETVADATGAGDSFRAGFYAVLYHRYDIHESLVIASAMSSFVVEKVGAMTAAPTWDQVLERADPYLREI
jgi:sugar/nucleoside kinase (ribokinase family)